VSLNLIEDNLCPLDICCISMTVNLVEGVAFRTTSSYWITYFWAVHFI